MAEVNSAGAPSVLHTPTDNLESEDRTLVEEEGDEEEWATHDEGQLLGIWHNHMITEVEGPKH